MFSRTRDYSRIIKINDRKQTRVILNTRVLSAPLHLFGSIKCRRQSDARETPHLTRQMRQLSNCPRYRRVTPQMGERITGHATCWRHATQMMPPKPHARCSRL